MFPEQLELHMADVVNNFVNWLLESFPAIFDAISNVVLSVLLAIHNGLAAIPWWVIILFVAAVCWFTTREWLKSVILSLLLFTIGLFGLWSLAIETLALISTAVFIALIFGIPLGILMAEVDFMHSLVKPILDAMQTMPSFVYLIPAMMLFGLGKVPGVLATVIYSTPPVARLTNLGIRTVDKAVEEAATAFGATRWQLLKEVRLPLAMPSILAGVNQTTMMALAMVVITSMIGASGLGQEVLRSINRIDVGRGFEAGFSVVVLAIVIDRLTQGIASRWDVPEDSSEA